MGVLDMNTQRGAKTIFLLSMCQALLVLSIFVVPSVSIASSFTPTAQGAILYEPPFNGWSSAGQLVPVSTYIFKNYSANNAVQAKTSMSFLTLVLASAIGIAFMVGFAKGVRA